MAARPYIIAHVCPECGGTAYMDTDCPGFERNGRVMVCQGCGNALRFTCGCGWWYRNPDFGLRGDSATMGKGPDWIGQYTLDPDDGDDEDGS